MDNGKVQSWNPCRDGYAADRRPVYIRLIGEAETMAAVNFLNTPTMADLSQFDRFDAISGSLNCIVIKVDGSAHRKKLLEAIEIAYRAQECASDAWGVWPSDDEYHRTLVECYNRKKDPAERLYMLGGRTKQRRLAADATNNESPTRARGQRGGVKERERREARAAGALQIRTPVGRDRNYDRHRRVYQRSSVTKPVRTFSLSSRSSSRDSHGKMRDLIAAHLPVYDLCQLQSTCHALRWFASDMYWRDQVARNIRLGNDSLGAFLNYVAYRNPRMRIETEPESCTIRTISWRLPNTRADYETIYTDGVFRVQSHKFKEAVQACLGSLLDANMFGIRRGESLRFSDYSYTPPPTLAGFPRSALDAATANYELVDLATAPAHDERRTWFFLAQSIYVDLMAQSDTLQGRDAASALSNYFCLMSTNDNLTLEDAFASSYVGDRACTLCGGNGAFAMSRIFPRLQTPTCRHRCFRALFQRGAASVHCSGPGCAELVDLRARVRMLEDAPHVIVPDSNVAQKIFATYLYSVEISEIPISTVAPPVVGEPRPRVSGHPTVPVYRRALKEHYKAHTASTRRRGNFMEQQPPVPLQTFGKENAYNRTYAIYTPLLWARLDPDKKDMPAEVHAFCSRECQRRHNRGIESPITRCLNANCRTVLAPATATVDKNCIAMVDRRTRAHVGYVCDPYCACDHVAAVLVRLALRKRRQQQQRKPVVAESARKKARVEST